MSVIDVLVKYTMLPAEITDFEKNYLKRLNKVALIFFYCHIPVFMVVAWVCNTGPLIALGLSLATLVGPTVAYFNLSNVRAVSVVYGFTAMLMGGLLVHFGQGPVQIEMHFYFFALLAMLCMFSNPMVNVVAAVTVAVHHLVVWYFLPASVFNYEAPFWVVIVHAAFVVLETVAACFISRQFFDNVIGLEKIVQLRTVQIQEKQKDMRLLLDNINQGLITIDVHGKMSSEMSAVVESWFGKPASGMSFMDYINVKDPDFSEWFDLGLDAIKDDFLPLEVCIEQLPKLIKLENGQTLQAKYQIIQQLAESNNVTEAESQAENECELHGLKLLIVLSDITDALKKKEAEVQQRQLLQVFEHIVNDKHSFMEYVSETESILKVISEKSYRDLAGLKRALHTIKGNSGLFGLHSVAEVCHILEGFIDEESEEPAEKEVQVLMKEWDHVLSQLRQFLGELKEQNIEVLRTDYNEVIKALDNKPGAENILSLVKSWELEPMDRRLGFIKQQTEALAKRLGKGEVIAEINVDAEQIRFDCDRWKSFWSNFTHVIRNAVDHGIEPQSERELLGKEGAGKIVVESHICDGSFIVSLSDDGRGIDWERLREKGQTMGLPCGSESELIELIFTDGISTKDQATQISGRGVGMSAIRQACIELGGEIEIITEAGKGTRFNFVFPMDDSIYLRAS